MNKIIKEIPNKPFLLEDVTDDTIVGAKCGLEKFQCFCEKGYFVFRNFTDDFYSGHSGTHRTKRDCVQRALVVPGTEVYQFDSYRELYTWLLQKD